MHIIEHLHTATCPSLLTRETFALNIHKYGTTGHEVEQRDACKLILPQATLCHLIEPRAYLGLT